MPQNVIINIVGPNGVAPANNLPQTGADWLSFAQTHAVLLALLLLAVALLSFSVVQRRKLGAVAKRDRLYQWLRLSSSN